MPTFDLFKNPDQRDNFEDARIFAFRALWECMADAAKDKVRIYSRSSVLGYTKVHQDKIVII